VAFLIGLSAHHRFGSLDYYHLPFNGGNWPVLFVTPAYDQVVLHRQKDQCAVLVSGVNMVGKYLIARLWLTCGAEQILEYQLLQFGPELVRGRQRGL
jgi:hypothetical protein